MPRVSDILLPLWILYVTFMTVASWFSESVNSFENFLMSIVAWALMVAAGFAMRGRD